MPASSLIIYFLLLVFSFAAPAAARTCSNSSFSSCPPFSSGGGGTGYFPFSSTPGCGHPSFHVSCSFPHSIISVNNLSLAVLHYKPNSSTLFVSPQPTSSFPETTPSYNHDQFTSCSSPRFPSIPNRPIDFSGSPFRISDASCSRFSLLHRCSSRSSSSSSNVSSTCSSDCPWECKLIESPVLMLQGCGSDNSSPSEQGCQQDVLGYLDKLLKSGIQIEWDDRDVYFSNCRSCKAKSGACGFNSSDPDKGFLCFDSISGSSSPSPWIDRYNRHRIAILSSVFAVTSVAFVLVVFIVVFRWRQLRSLGGGGGEEDPTIVFLHRHRSANLLPPLFTYEELESSTNRFDPKRKIGDGGFGSVYLGQLDDRRLVAVKHLHRHHATAAARRAFTTKSFCNEILILSSIDHPNLVKLHGYCSDPRGLLLVYDYVPNGTLADHLHGPKKSLYRKGSPMTWQIRVDIALQTAMAIEYLHFSVQPAIVHRDVTSSNIFVEKDMRIKLGDFGLSRLLVFPETTPSSSSSMQCVWTGPQGTPGYLDPDYHRSFRLTEKSDVYSFGVVLLELISGKKAVDQSRERREAALADLVVPKIQMGLLRQVVDPALMTDGKEDGDYDGGGCGVAAMAELAFRCVAADKEDRPDAKEVVAELKRIRSRTRGGEKGASDGAKV